MLCWWPSVNLTVGSNSFLGRITVSLRGERKSLSLMNKLKVQEVIQLFCINTRKFGHFSSFEFFSNLSINSWMILVCSILSSRLLGTVRKIIQLVTSSCYNLYSPHEKWVQALKWNESSLFAVPQLQAACSLFHNRGSYLLINIKHPSMSMPFEISAKDLSGLETTLALWC